MKKHEPGQLNQRALRPPLFKFFLLSSYSPLSSISLLGYALFGKFVCLQAGALFFLAGAICFFAYNWFALGSYIKFALLIVPMVLSFALAYWKKVRSNIGSFALLVCGLLAGMLMTVYGQTYQTGANAWELFFSWSIVLLAFALVSLSVGLWLATFIVSSLAFFFYLDIGDVWLLFTPRSVYIINLFLVWLVVWEGAKFVVEKKRKVLPELWVLTQSRIVPRLAGAALLFSLTWQMGGHILGNSPLSLLYIQYFAVLVLGACWYIKVYPETFLPAAGLLSLAIVLFCFSIQGSGDVVGMLIWGAFYFLSAACGVGFAIKQLYVRERASHKNRSVTAENEAIGQNNGQKIAAYALARLAYLGPNRAHEKVHTQDNPWFARLFQGVLLWLAIPCLLGVLGFYLLRNSQGQFVAAIVMTVVAAALGSKTYSGTQISAILSLAAILTFSFALSLLLFENPEKESVALLFCCSASVVALVVKNAFVRFLAVFVDIFFFPVLLWVFTGAQLYSIGIITDVYTMLSFYTLLNTLFYLLFFTMLSLSFVNFVHSLHNRKQDGNEAQSPLHESESTACETTVTENKTVERIEKKRITPQEIWKQFFQSEKFRLGGLLAVALWAITITLDYSDWDLRETLLVSFGTTRSFSIGMAFGITLFIYMLMCTYANRGTVLLASVLIGVLAGWAGMFYLWIPAGFFGLIYGRASGSLPITGAFFCYLTLLTIGSYYSSFVSLLSKSVSLCLIGAGLLLLGLLVGVLIKRGVNKGDLPDPTHIASGTVI